MAEEVVYLGDGPLAYRRKVIEEGTDEVTFEHEAPDVVYHRTDELEGDEAIFKVNP